MTTTPNKFADPVAPSGQQVPSSSCASNAGLALPSAGDLPATAKAAHAHGGQGPSETTSTAKTANEFIEDGPHSDEFPLTAPVSAPAAAVHSDDDDDEYKCVAHHFTKAKRLVDVKQCDPAALFRLNTVPEHVKDALHLFLLRHAKLKWMGAQQLYVPLAAMAAAHESMHPVLHNVATFHSLRLVDSKEFDVLGILKCGIPVKPRVGFPPFWVCDQPERCPRCNLQRVQPAKDEFLPAFERGKAWYSVTVMGRSNPDQAGVKIEVGRDANNKPIYDYLFRPSDHFKFAKLSKFGLDDPDNRPNIVGESLQKFMTWLTDGKYFDGLHTFRDVDLSFFPDKRSGVGTGIAHTCNCHQHGYGNTARIFTSKIAARMWFGCVKVLRKHPDAFGELCAYPDILIRPLPTPKALKKAINYVIKPFKWVNWYLNGLKHGCPVRALNGEFYQTAYNLDLVLPGTAQGTVLGNMSQKSGAYYIGDPPPVVLSKQQVKRYLERSAADEAHAWESVRYVNHLEILANRNRKKAKNETKTETNNHPARNHVA